MSCLSPDQKSRVAFVFFDNEENGMLGSAFFAKKYKHCMADKLVINFDCVSDGDTLLIIRSKKARTTYGEAIEAAFGPAAEKTIRLEKSATTLYPSDQLQFPCHVAVAAMKRARFIGLYLDRIHTKHDTVFDARNIEYLTQSARRLTERLT